jgi:hypothetical protein
VTPPRTSAGLAVLQNLSRQFPKDSLSGTEIRLEEPEVARPDCGRPATRSRCCLPLLDARAAALNQDDKHDHKKHTGNNPDKRGTIHCDPPFFIF